MGRKIECNKEYFRVWSKDMAYILGFLCADGNIVKTARGTCFVAFYSKDRSIISFVRKALHSNHKLSRILGKNGYLYRLQIGSKAMFEDLVSMGLPPCKARRMEVPLFPKKYAPDFIRGYFDGDGHVWHGANNVRRKHPSYAMQAVFTSASEQFLLQLLGLLRTLGCTAGSVCKSRTGEYARLQLSTQDALKLYGIMYNDRRTFCLRRKRDIFEKYIKMRV